MAFLASETPPRMSENRPGGHRMKVQQTMLRTTLFASAAAAACLGAPVEAFAQAKPAAKGDVAVSEIVVTGSRIRRDTFETRMPLAVVTSQKISPSGIA